MESTIIRRPLERFWLLLKPDRSEIRNVYIYSVFNGLVNLSLPIGIQAIINLIQGGRVSTSFIVLLTLVILGVILTGILQVNQLRITENLQQKIFARAAFEFAYRIPRIDLKELRGRYAPELMNRFFDVVSVQKGLAKVIMDFSTASIQVFFGLILLSVYHPFFILFSIILVLLVYSIFKITAKKGLLTSLEESKHKYNLAHWLQELARANITFKLAGKTDLGLQKTDENADKYINARESHFKVLIQQYALMIGFKVIITAGLLAIGGLLVMEQQMNIGQFVASEIIILMILSSVEKIILNLETIYDLLTSLEKIAQVTDLDLDKAEDEGASMVFERMPFSIEIKELSFSYPAMTNRSVLKELNFSVEAGQNVIITGENGSGKTTLLNLMAGLYKPTDGQVVYNGLPITSIEPGLLRRHMGIYMSSEGLFEGTIIENISIGRFGITLSDVQVAAKAMRLENFIKQLPDGYNTVVYPQGKQFPKGVIEKILLARAIVSDPNLLLIEDNFNSIEPNERKAIIDFLYDPKHDWTMISASTDPYCHGKADKVITLHDGKMG